MSFLFKYQITRTCNVLYYNVMSFSGHFVTRYIIIMIIHFSLSNCEDLDFRVTTCAHAVATRELAPDEECAGVAQDLAHHRHVEVVASGDARQTHADAEQHVTQRDVVNV